MSEVWKPIKGYEGFYEVSDHGRVRSLTRLINTPVPHMLTMFKKEQKGKIIKPYISKTTGYMYVSLWKNGKREKYTVHRLVANAFLPIDPERNLVNHLDYDRQNNCVENLEWATAKENICYSSDRMSKAHLYKNNGDEKMLYIRKTKSGTYRLYIKRLNFSKNFKNLDDAVAAREVILNDEKHLAE